jgi:ribosomal-protein-alanine N-acetyltransferase
MSDAYEIILMTSSHLDQVMEIERESYPNPWARAAFEAEVRKSGVTWPRVAVTAGSPPEVAGYCIAWFLFEHVHVQNLAVHPRHRRRGLARLFVVGALEEGRARGATAALLEVRRSNVAAQTLYRGLGFVEAGTRIAYYSKPREDALLFRRELG